VTWHSSQRRPQALEAPATLHGLEARATQEQVTTRRPPSIRDAGVVSYRGVRHARSQLSAASLAGPALAALSVWAALAVRAETPASQPAYAVTTGAAPGYVGEAACATCHAAIARTYREVGMHQSFYRPSSAKIIEDFERNHFYHAASGRHYEMSWRDGQMYMKRYQLTDDGGQMNVLEQRVDYVIGSGHHSRGYVYRNDAGELYGLPVVWYTQEKSWGMAPGYDRPDHDDFTRPITRACMFCHNAYPDVPAGSDHYGQPDVFPANLPEGIGCERCHGPGAEHVRLANDADADPDAVRTSIVHPGKLTLDLQHDLCMQCHMQPSSKRTSFWRRFGRGDYSYRPGQPLIDYMMFLDVEGLPNDADRFEIDSHAYRMRQSTCFTASSGRLTCTTCHDPHRKVPADESIAHYRTACFGCHTQESCPIDLMSKGDHSVPPGDCTSCHMPKRRTEDVVHVVMTDHRIQRWKPERDLLAPLAETPQPDGGQVRIYPSGRSLGTAIDDVYTSLAALRDRQSGGLEALQAAIRALEPADRSGPSERPDASLFALDPYVELGIAQLGMRKFADAAGTFERVVTAHPDLALGHANLGVAAAGLGQDERAVQHLRHAIELDRRSPDAHFNLGASLARLNRHEEAIAQYDTALSLRPIYAKTHFNLGNIHARQNGYDVAAEHFGLAAAADPDLVAAYNNLGSALRRARGPRQDNPRGLDELSASVAWRSAVSAWRFGLQRGWHAGMAENLASAYIAPPDPSLENAAEALRLIEQVVRRDDRHPEPVFTYALALLRNGRDEPAIEASRRAAALGADKANCVLIEGIALRHLGRSHEAADRFAAARLAAAENESTDPVRKLLLRLAAEPPAPTSRPAIP